MERPVGTGTGDEPGSRHSGSLLVLHEDPPATNPAITGLTLIGFTLWPANLPLLAAPTSPLFSSMPVAVDFLRASCQGIMWAQQSC